MLVLKAKEKMSYYNRTMIEEELSSKLNDDVVIIPSDFEIVAFDYRGHNEELEYHPDDVRLNFAKEAIQRVEEHYNNTCSKGCRCNG